MGTQLRRGLLAIGGSAVLLAACASDPEGSFGSRDRSASGTGTSDVPAQPGGGEPIDDGDTTGMGSSAGAAGNGSPSAEPSVGGAAGRPPSRPPTSGDFTSGLTPPDPNVTFEWTASLPGSGDCRPGRYTGTFSCEYFFAATDPAPLAIVTGPVAITLEESQDGEFLEISDGKLEGVAQLIFGFRAELQGKLECATRRLDATAVNGAYGFGDPAVLPLGTFQGALGGVLDAATAALAGDWDLSVTGGGAGGFCKGPWQANWAP
jgi:hypothetical protein